MTEPVKWGTGRLQDFTAWINFELTYALQARMGLERQWRDWLVQYRPAAKQPLRRFPFEGAANHVLPLTAIDVDQLFASFIQTLHASDDLWAVGALNERWEPVAKPLQDFLTFLDKSVLKMYQVNKRVLLEMVKLGTGIYKHGYTFEQRPVWTYDATGKRVKRTKTISRPFVDHVPLHDFILPPAAIDIQPDVPGGAPWVAHRIRMPTAKFRSLANRWAPLYPEVPLAQIETVIQFEERTQTEYGQKVQDLDYIKRAWQPVNFDQDSTIGSTKSPGGGPAYVTEIELYEIHARFGTTGDSEDDIIVWYHQPTQTVLRPVYQPYHHGQRPFEVIRYFPGDGFYGIGVCEQKEQFQTMVSDLFNFQHDGVLLSNSIGIVARAGSNIAPGEPVIPGKVWLTDGNVREDFTTFQMGQIYPSLPQLIQFVHGVGERRTAMSDLQFGNMQSLPSRTPASTVQSLLAEGKRRPDLTVKDMRYSGVGVLGLRILQLLQQYATSPQDINGQSWLQIAVETLGMPEGPMVAEMLAMPMENVEMGLGVSISAVSGTANKELEKQNLQSLLALHAQLAPQYLQLVQTAVQFQGTPVGTTAYDLAVGQGKLYRRLLEQFDFRDPDAIAPDVSAPQTPPVGPTDPGAGAVGGGPFGGPAGDPGMAGVLQGAGMGVPVGGGGVPDGPFA